MPYSASQGATQASDTTQACGRRRRAGVRAQGATQVSSPWQVLRRGVSRFLRRGGLVCVGRFCFRPMSHTDPATSDHVLAARRATTRTYQKPPQALQWRTQAPVQIAPRGTAPATRAGSSETAA
eukprot:1567006-Prymnesium_polylepis.1